MVLEGYLPLIEANVRRQQYRSAKKMKKRVRWKAITRPSGDRVGLVMKLQGGRQEQSEETPPSLRLDKSGNITQGTIEHSNWESFNDLINRSL